jgi:hypothetical protein
MRNAELIRLFDLVAAGTTVNIRND